jgi:AsmA family protein
MIADFSLQKGLLNTRTLLLVTKEANVHGTGWVNLRNETVDYKLNTKAAHFSIGSLHAPIAINGPLKHPSIRPEVGELALRGGIAGAFHADRAACEAPVWRPGLSIIAQTTPT